jgi:hypothetical protein
MKTSIHENNFTEKRKTTLRIKKTSLEKKQSFENIYKENISKEDNYDQKRWF